MGSFFVYILQSDKHGRYYIGCSHNPDKRLIAHNQGFATYTSKGIPWKLKYTEEYTSKTDALKREQQIKKMKSRRYIMDLIENEYIWSVPKIGILGSTILNKSR